jgi:glucokinase
VSTAALRVGIDIGGTKILATAIDGDDQIVASVRAATPLGGEAVVAAAHAAVEELRGQLRGRPLASVGLGIPGQVDHDLGTVAHAVNLGIGEAVAIGPALAARTGLPVGVENDVNAAALGAAALLRPGRPADLAYLSVGTGVAAGLILDGRLRRGSHRVSGEIGHLRVAPDGPRCECGLIGCLEAVASGAAIARQWPGTDGQSPAEQLFAAAADGDPAAIELRDTVAGHLADAVVLLAVTVDPELVVLGGGVAEVGLPLLAAVRRSLVARADRSPFRRSLELADRTVLVPTGISAGILGAALVAPPAPSVEPEAVA